MELRVTGELVYWRGPSPWHFVTVPAPQSEAIAAVAPRVTYGWGVIPVTATIGDTVWTTSLFPKEGRYLVPVKTWVREKVGVELGDVVTVDLRVGV